MATWHLVRSLDRFRAAVNARWPHRDKGSDGTIGDAEHQASSSDHNPDSDGSVDAWDMDVDGVDVGACIGAALAHESIQYVIYNRRITSRSMAGGLGVWHPYTGPSPHTEHVHFNTRPSHETSSAPWNLGGGSFMSGLSDAEQQQLYTWVKDLNYLIWSGAQKADGSGRTDIREEFYKIQRALAAQGGGGDDVDESAIAGLVVGGVLAALTPEAIAAAIPADLAARVADELAERLKA